MQRALAASVRCYGLAAPGALRARCKATSVAAASRAGAWPALRPNRAAPTSGAARLGVSRRAVRVARACGLMTAAGYFASGLAGSGMGALISRFGFETGWFGLGNHCEKITNIQQKVFFFLRTVHVQKNEEMLFPEEEKTGVAQ